MTEKKTLSEAQIRAHKKYMENFVEVKVRMTPEKRETIKIHAKKQGESTTSFINRAIDETMERDNSALPEDINILKESGNTDKPDLKQHITNKGKH